MTKSDQASEPLTSNPSNELEAMRAERDYWISERDKYSALEERVRAERDKLRDYAVELLARLNRKPPPGKHEYIDCPKSGCPDCYGWRAADETFAGPPCGCGQPEKPGIEHRRGGPCYGKPPESIKNWNPDDGT